LKGLEIQELYGVDLGWKSAGLTERREMLSRADRNAMGLRRKR
jgi:hypothetical protein